MYNGRKTTSFVEIETERKAFGFNKKELMSVAAKIADNLTFADDVSDEDVKHKPILAEYIETESGKNFNSLNFLQRWRCTEKRTLF